MNAGQGHTSTLSAMLPQRGGPGNPRAGPFVAGMLAGACWPGRASALDALERGLGWEASWKTRSRLILLIVGELPLTRPPPFRAQSPHERAVTLVLL